jgi:hypothetical protein
LQFGLVRFSEIKTANQTARFKRKMIRVVQTNCGFLWFSVWIGSVCSSNFRVQTCIILKWFYIESETGSNVGDVFAFINICLLGFKICSHFRMRAGYFCNGEFPTMGDNMTEQCHMEVKGLQGTLQGAWEGMKDVKRKT